MIPYGRLFTAFGPHIPHMALYCTFVPPIAPYPMATFGPLRALNDPLSTKAPMPSKGTTIQALFFGSFLRIATKVGDSFSLFPVI